jgi:hypothetical protein
MIDAIFRPLQSPGYKHRKASPFSSKWSATLDLLEDELNKLGAKNIVIQAGFKLPQIRNDGWPRSGEKPSHPAVVLSFNDRKGNPLSFPCDTYNGHEQNIRAIALSLQALRAVNRYGVVKTDEQYRGFTALPAADPQVRRNQALAFLSRVTGWNLNQVSNDLQGAYRLAASAVHPDKTGGSHDKFVELQGHWQALQAA